VSPSEIYAVMASKSSKSNRAPAVWPKMLLKKEEAELQKLTDDYIAQISKILELKEKEIMEV
jgi:Ribosome recycling factor